MTSVNMPRDDAANLINSKALPDNSVKEVSPYSTVQPVKPHEDVMQAPQRRQLPRKISQRRKGERRKQKQQVLLDTRSGRDRRNVVSSEALEIEGDGQTGIAGIDVYS